MIRYRIPLIFHFLGILFAAIVLSACQKSPGSTNTSTISLQTIENKGSDTMVNLALAWAEAYQAKRPDISISVTGGGSGTGMAALINGTVDIANASRQIKPEERANAELNGAFPTEFIVARDAIAVIVNPENPVDRLTIDQISDIYSGKINNWSEVGGKNLLIVRLSRETNSGTHIYFLEHVLRKGNKEDRTLFSTDTLLLPSSEGIGSEIRQNPHAIGYDGLGYVTEDMKVIAVSTTTESPYVLPSIHTVTTQEYPISRDLYMYSSGEPIGNVRDYLEWILSSEAQEIVLELGFVPITPQ
jgi:phosphate transport system substrate-binding protein